MKQLYTISVLIMLAATISCGSGGKATAPTGALSGNWQISLNRHVLPNPALVFSGFLIQSGNSISGTVSLGSNCLGVGPVSGTIDDQNVALTINEFGEEISLQGSMPTATEPMTGEFSNLAGGCTAYTNTGTWSAIQIAPLSGGFHGTFVSSPAIGNGTVDVSGTLNQGPNTGNSSASLSGNINATSDAQFCSYLSSATITGLISGTAVMLNLYGPNGAEIAQIGNLSSTPAVTVTPDATSVSGTYVFPGTSTSCTGDQGTFQLTFP